MLTLLQLPLLQDGCEVDVEAYVVSSMDVIEARIQELIASADAEKVLGFFVLLTGTLMIVLRFIFACFLCSCYAASLNGGKMKS